jgi:hypothetical protein
MVMLLRDLGPYGIIFMTTCVYYFRFFPSFLTVNLLVINTNVPNITEFKLSIRVTDVSTSDFMLGCSKLLIPEPNPGTQTRPQHCALI